MKYFLTFALLFSLSSKCDAQSKAIDRISTAFGGCVSALETRVDEISDLKSKLIAAQKEIDDLKKPRPKETLEK